MGRVLHLNLFIPASVKRRYAYINCKSFYGERYVDRSKQDYADAGMDENLFDYESVWGGEFYVETGNGGICGY